MIKRSSLTAALVTLALGACLPSRFRAASDATNEDSSREDVATADDRSATDATTDAIMDVTMIDDVTVLDAPSDTTIAATDGRSDVFSDAPAESGSDADAAPAPDGATCSTACTANSACVAGACVARSCRGVQELRNLAGLGLSDSDYTIDPDGAGPETPFSVYCADLAMTPLEYLSVSPGQNVLRTVDSNTIPVTSTNDCGAWETRWTRVRLLIDRSGSSPKYAIDSSDFRFVNETIDPPCASGNLYRTTRTNMVRNPYHRMYGVSHACEYRGLNQHFRANIANTGFRFPPDRISRFKIENYSSGQANSFAMWEGAYGFVIGVDAQCGSIVPIEWDRGGPGEPPAAADGTPPIAQSSTWRIPIVRSVTMDADPAPGASCAQPVITAPLGSDLRRSGLFQARFSALPGSAPTGANCQNSGLPSEAVWLSVEVPAMTQRRLVAESNPSDPAILRVVNACGGDCAQVSAPSTIPMSGTTFVILDNSANPAARTFLVAASSRNGSSRFGTNFMNFVVQRVDVPACNSVLPSNSTGLGLPSLTNTSVNGRTLTLSWSLGTCATGAYAELCTDAACTTSYCSNGRDPVPCSYHMPAMSPTFDINFRTSGTFFVRLRSLRFWIPGSAGEPVYGSEVITPTTTSAQMVVIP